MGRRDLHRQRPLAVALSLLGLAVGALAGLLLRRALAAGGLAFIATALVDTALGTARPHLWPWATGHGTLATGYATPSNVLFGDKGAVTSTGAHIADPGCGKSEKCLAAHDVTGYFSHYHPASHFWPSSWWKPASSSP